MAPRMRCSARVLSFRFRFGSKRSMARMRPIVPVVVEFNLRATAMQAPREKPQYVLSLHVPPLDPGPQSSTRCLPMRSDLANYWRVRAGFTILSTCVR